MSSVMHAVQEGTATAVQSIFAHWFRSILTALGIIIGIASVIAMVTIMEGLGASVGAQLNDFGSDMVTLRARTSPSMEMLGITSRLSYDDYETLRHRVSGVAAIAARMRPYSLASAVEYRGTLVHTQVLGTESDYQYVVNTYPEQGRFFNSNDDLRRRRIAVLGKSVVSELGLPENPVGEYIQMEGEWFMVVGVAEPRGSLLGIDQDDYIIVPLQTVRAVLSSQEADDVQIVFRPESAEDLPEIIRTMRGLLRAKHRLAPEEDDFFEFETAEHTRKRFDEISRSITLVAAGIVGISLIIGGIGIMNIMLMSVSERTREIGLAKSLGATPRVILTQFLVEASLLALFGGVIGVLSGYLVAMLLMALLPLGASVSVPAWAIWLALVFSASVGILFGMAPAIKASRLDPIDALRHE